MDGPDGFHADIPAIVEAALSSQAKLVFLCSPSNPAGSAIALDKIETALQALQGRALVVVDEAYGEFSDIASAVSLLARYDNLAVLRTLSKAHALAAARIGSLIANDELIALLRRCQAPYPVPTPCAAMAEQALSAPALEVTRRRIAEVHSERTRVHTALEQLAGVRQVYPRRATFCWCVSTMQKPHSRRCWRPAWWCAINARYRSCPMPCASPWARPNRTRVLSALQRTQEAAA